MSQAITVEPDMSHTEQQLGAVEAVLLTSDKPVGAGRLAEACGLADAAAVKEAIAALNAAYDETGRSFRIEPVAGGFRVMTRPAFADAVSAVRGMREQHRLSRAAIETLSIIAYRQPITRASVESIRGVSCGDILRTLLERRLVSIVGRAEELGRPILYGTSRHFLEVFGLASLRDLPQVAELFPGVAEGEAEPAAPIADGPGAGGRSGGGEGAGSGGDSGGAG